MDISIQIEGLDRVIDAVRKAPEVVREVVDVAVLEAAGIVQEEAQNHHRFKTRDGALERSVTVRDSGSASAEVFLDEGVARYAPFVHEGTRPHKIFPVNRKALRFVSRGGAFAFARSISHPGTKPDRFLYEASDRKQGEVQARIQSGVDAAIQEAGL
jgi:HK97 gp10 family phage protein